MESPGITKWIMRFTAAVAIVSLTVSAASARLIFQNDSEFNMEADNLVIDSDSNGGTGEVYVKFNNSGTASENGLITWDINNEKFIIANDIDLTGTATVMGEFNATGAASFRIRQTADVVDGTTICSYVDEIILDTGEDAIYVCTGVDPANTWSKASANASVDSDSSDPSTPCTVGTMFYNTTDEELKYCTGTTWETVGPQDFEQVFATDTDGTLTTNNTAFTIDTGTAALNFDASTFDIDATTLDVNATTQTFVGTNISFDADDWDITDAGLATFVSTTTGDLTATGDVDFSGADSVRTRETSDISTLACTVVGDIVLDTTSDRLYVCTAVGTPGTYKALGGAKVDQLVFNPEYPNGAIDATTGSGANKGSLSTVFEDALNREYYNWVTTQTTLQDLNLKFKVTLPEDFSSFGTLTLDYRTNTATAADNNVDITIRDITTLGSPVTCATVTGLAATSWTTNTIAAATLEGACSASAAGSIIEVTINLAATNGGDFARVGQVKMNYNN